MPFTLHILIWLTASSFLFVFFFRFFLFLLMAGTASIKEGMDVGQ